MAIAHWSNGKLLGLVLIRLEHVEIVRAGTAGTRACSSKREDAGAHEGDAGHTLRVRSGEGLLYLGKVGDRARGRETVLNRVEIDALEKAIEELVG